MALLSGVFSTFFNNEAFSEKVLLVTVDSSPSSVSSSLSKPEIKASLDHEEVRAYPIIPALLAAYSPFFKSLFSNGTLLCRCKSVSNSKDRYNL